MIVVVVIFTLLLIKLSNRKSGCVLSIWVWLYKALNSKSLLTIVTKISSPTITIYRKDLVEWPFWERKYAIVQKIWICSFLTLCSRSHKDSSCCIICNMKTKDSAFVDMWVLYFFFFNLCKDISRGNKFQRFCQLSFYS